MKTETANQDRIEEPPSSDIDAPLIVRTILRGSVVEVYRASENDFHVVVNDVPAVRIKAVERNLAFGTSRQYQPTNVKGYYYDTLMDALEGAVKKVVKKRQ